MPDIFDQLVPDKKDVFDLLKPETASYLPPLPPVYFHPEGPKPSIWSTPALDFSPAASESPVGIPRIPAFGSGVVRKLSEAAGGAQESVLGGLSQMTTPANAAALPLFAVPYVGPALGLGLGAKMIGGGLGNVVGGLETLQPRSVGAGLGEMGLGGLATLPFAKSVYKGATRPASSDEARFQAAKNITPKGVQDVPTTSPKLLGEGEGLQKPVQERPAVPPEVPKAESVTPKENLYLESPDVLRSQSGFRATSKVPGQQLWNRLRNLSTQGKISSAEFEHLNEAGLKEFLSEARTPEETAKWVEEQGKGVEVVKAGQGTLHPDQKTFLEFQHQWFDRQTPTAQRVLMDFADDKVDLSNVEKALDLVPNDPENVEFLSNVQKYRDLFQKSKSVPYNPRETHWQSISPKPESEMPGYVELAVVKPNKNRLEIERLSKQQMALDQSTAMGMTEAHMLQSKINNLAQGRAAEPKFPSSHRFPPNTLGWIRGYMETTKEGKKVFHVIEAQSDWGQNVREQKERGIPESMIKMAQRGDPLLPDWERLLVKAAITHAKEVGADAIAFSDAETAMMTEEHDRSSVPVAYPREYQTFATEREAMLYAGDSGMVWGGPGGWKASKTNKRTSEPEQAKGMRLHYDTILPKITGELTESKPQKVAFGEHKMAFEPTQTGTHREEFQKNVPRKDLIFREPTGELKTLVTANMFSLENVKDKSFSLAGKDVYKAPTKPANKEKGFILKTKEPASGLPARTGAGPVASPPSGGGLGPPEPPSTTPSGAPAGGELPIPIRREKTRAERFGEALRSWWQGRQLRHDTIPAMMDAGLNEARISARQAVNDLKNRLNTAVGHLATKEERQALSFVVEAKGDKAQIAAFREQIRSLNKPTIEQVLNVAERQWEKLLPVAKFYEEVNTWQVKSHENPNGVATDFRQGYVPHVADLSDVNALLFESGKPGMGGGFTKQRVHETFAEGMKAGVKYRSLDAVDLMEHRLAAGNVKVNMNLLVDALKEVKDPASGETIIRDLEIRQKELPSGQKKSETLTPAGYNSMFIGTHPVAVHKGYAGMLEALTQPSEFSRSSLTRGVMQAVSLAKHTTLLFDLYHPIRLFFYSAPLRGWKSFTQSSKPGLWLLDYNEDTLRRMADGGEIPKDVLPGLIENQHIRQVALSTGFNVGRINDALWTEFLRKIPGIGGYNRWLFDEFQRGLMIETYIGEFKRWKEAHPDLNDAQVGRYVSKNLNVRFGNMMNQSWIKSKTKTDLLRMLFLAPQWNEGLIRSEVGAALQLGELAREGTERTFGPKKPGRIVPGTLLKDIGTIFAAYFIANQFINFLSRGKPTWENKDDYPGANISAWIPDKLGSSEGFFLNPMSLSAEVSHQIIARSEKRGSTIEGAKDVVQFKLSSLGRLMNVLWSGEDWRGNHLSDWERIKEAVKEGAPLPIQTPALMDVVKGKEAYPGEAQKNIMSTLGVKTDTKKTTTEERSQGLTLQQRAEEQKKRTRSVDIAAQEVGARKGVEQMAQAKKDVRAGLSKDVVKFLDTNKMPTPGYQDFLMVGGQRIPLTKEEQVFLKKAVVAEYEKAYRRVMTIPGFDTLSPLRKQERAEPFLKDARTKARISLEKAIKSGDVHIMNTTKKRRFSIIQEE